MQRQLGKQEKKSKRVYKMQEERLKASDGGRADIKEAFVQASSSTCMRIRAREQRTLRTLRGGIECLRCRTLSSRLSALNFFIFIINYFSLIARIRKRGREKGRSGSLESQSCVCVCMHAVCLHIPLFPVYKEENKGKKHKLNILGQQGCQHSVVDCAC